MVLRPQLMQFELVKGRHPSSVYNVPCFPYVQVLKIAILSEKYAHDYTWYVDTILNLIHLAGDYVSEEVWYRIVQVVINTQEVQGYAAKTCFEVRKRLCVCV